VRGGTEAFESLFAPNVEGAYGKAFHRSGSHPPWLPTDDQAEVLVLDRIQREDILGVVVRDESQAKREVARLEQLDAPVPQIIIAPLFFSAGQMSRSLRNGDLPVEREYHLGGDDHA
jgi:hypothetical protein